MGKCQVFAPFSIEHAAHSPAITSSHPEGDGRKGNGHVYNKMVRMHWSQQDGHRYNAHDVIGHGPMAPIQ